MPVTFDYPEDKPHLKPIYDVVNMLSRIYSADSEEDEGGECGIIQHDGQ